MRSITEKQKTFIRALEEKVGYNVGVLDYLDTMGASALIVNLQDPEWVQQQIKNEEYMKKRERDFIENQAFAYTYYKGMF